jgi:hypothetical protein
MSDPNKKFQDKPEKVLIDETIGDMQLTVTEFTSFRIERKHPNCEIKHSSCDAELAEEIVDLYRSQQSGD